MAQFDATALFPAAPLLALLATGGRKRLPSRRRSSKIRPRAASRADDSSEEWRMSTDGTWKVSMQTPLGERRMTVSLKAAGDALTGKVVGDDGNSTEIFDGKLNGNNVSFKTSITSPMQLTLQVNGVVAGDKISGTVEARGVGSMPFTGTRA
jgi:hypothetical protein